VGADAIALTRVELMCYKVAADKGQGVLQRMTRKAEVTSVLSAAGEKVLQEAVKLEKKALSEKSSTTAAKPKGGNQKERPEFLVRRGFCRIWRKKWGKQVVFCLHGDRAFLLGGEMCQGSRMGGEAAGRW
jgi:hypothetical protein